MAEPKREHPTAVTNLPVSIIGADRGAVSGTPSYSAGTGLSTVTLDTVFTLGDNDVGRTFTFVSSGTGYVIAAVATGDVCTVTGDASGEAAGDSYTINRYFTILPSMRYQLTNTGLDFDEAADATAIWFTVVATTAPAASEGASRFKLPSSGQILVGPGVSVLRYGAAASKMPIFNIAPVDYWPGRY